MIEFKVNQFGLQKPLSSIFSTSPLHVYHLTKCIETPL